MMGSAYQQQQQQQQHPGSGRGSWSPTAHGNMAGGAGRLQGRPSSNAHDCACNLEALCRLWAVLANWTCVSFSITMSCPAPT
jgi:hypothetical protein